MSPPKMQTPRPLGGRRGAGTTHLHRSTTPANGNAWPHPPLRQRIRRAARWLRAVGVDLGTLSIAADYVANEGDEK
jgi:hypothetical protein